VVIAEYPYQVQSQERASVTCVEKNSALEDICQHLVANGSKKWKCVRTRYPNISEASFWRFVREAKAQIGERNLVDAIGKGISENAIPDTSQVIEGRSNLGGLDYLAALRSLYRDADRLCAHALNADGSVRNPVVLDRTIGTRLKLLVQTVRLERQIQDLGRTQKFFNAIVDEIAAEAPTVAHRIIERLRRLNNSTIE
jgi:hypothetical protein